MYRGLIAIGIAVVGAGPAFAQDVVGRKDGTFSLTERVGRGEWVRIASPNGSVRVTEGRGSEVEIRAVKDVRRGSIEDVGFVVRRGRDGLTVCAVFRDDDECDQDGNYHGGEYSSRWSRDHQIRVNFTVTVPKGARVKGSSGNGDVSIDGGLEVVAASGNGRVTVEGADGPVDASSGNGAIRVATSTGPVKASSGNGEIDVSMDRVEGHPDMEFTTGNGRITVTVPVGFGAELESSTGNGTVNADFPIQTRGRLNPSRLRGRLGGGGGRLVMTSGNGDIEIRQAKD